MNKPIENKTAPATLTAIENEVINLEQAENLLKIYFGFIDDECPTLEHKELKEEGWRAVNYARRTETFRAVLTASFDVIRTAKTNLSTLVYGIESA